MAYSKPQKLNHMQYAEAKSDQVAGASNGYTKDAVHWNLATSGSSEITIDGGGSQGKNLRNNDNHIACTTEIGWISRIDGKKVSVI